MGAFLFRNGFAHVDNVITFKNIHIADPVKVARQQTTPELSWTLRNPPEPSGSCLRNLHQHTLEPSGTFRIWAEDPISLHCWGKKQFWILLQMSKQHQTIKKRLEDIQLTNSKTHQTQRLFRQASAAVGIHVTLIFGRQHVALQAVLGNPPKVQVLEEKAADWGFFSRSLSKLQVLGENSDNYIWIHKIGELGVQFRTVSVGTPLLGL